MLQNNGLEAQIMLYVYLSTLNKIYMFVVYSSKTNLLNKSKKSKNEWRGKHFIALLKLRDEQYI